MVSYGKILNPCPLKTVQILLPIQAVTFINSVLIQFDQSVLTMTQTSVAMWHICVREQIHAGENGLPPETFHWECHIDKENLIEINKTLQTSFLIFRRLLNFIKQQLFFSCAFPLTYILYLCVFGYNSLHPNSYKHSFTYLIASNFSFKHC